MRYLRIFLLHFEQAFEYRSRNFVWFLVELFNPILYLLFWRGMLGVNKSALSGFTFSDITAYYFLLIFAGAFLVVHIEEDVAFLDIKEGGLTKYLTRPFSYFWLKFFEEFPWRIIQGVFGIVIFILFMTFYSNIVRPEITPYSILLIIAVGALAYFLSFVFKMIVGLSALWIIDYSGLQQLITVVFLVFAGFVIPIQFFHPYLRHIADVLPFSYIIYYPVMALQGKLTGYDAIRVLAAQSIWLVVLAVIYGKMWKKGIRMYTGIGQ